MRMRDPDRKPLSKRKLLVVFAAVLALLAVLVAGLYAGGRLLERSGSTQAFGSLAGRFEEEPVITYQGAQYVKNPSVSSFLFMGVDRREAQELEGGFRAGGQSDFLLLLVVDSSSRTVRRIQIDRDTMAEITVLGVLGNDLGTNTHQICLAHGFGDGREQSCRFTVEAVQRLLCGIAISGYLSLNLDGIQTLNDLLGGVTVTLKDDFSAFDPAMIPGATLTLRGRQAEIFVRQRMTIGDGTNASRMLRQQVFLEKAVELAGERVRRDAGFIGTLFDGLKPYMITDLSRGRMINEANKAAGYRMEGTLTLPGGHTTGPDGFVEFHADGDALMALVLDVFYTKSGD